MCRETASKQELDSDVYSVCMATYRGLNIELV